MIHKPTTIPEAVDTIVSLLSEEDKDYVRKNPHPRYHFFSGRIIRNNWSLWEQDSPLVQDALKNYGISHADDVSGLLFEWAFAKIRNQPFDPHELAKTYIEHWKKMKT